ncbi:hypothetical protein AVEN_60501-1 [Araneus ventricosus]|uniref:Uncharacterized protein n=1 Tax=Araneus ventricosus TaxID=182803 RepID=A0A4Y2G8S6_ARAVE|nr:hypothetical protein AVEN_60501-1 [Araneus ventricosus]
MGTQSVRCQLNGYTWKEVHTVLPSGDMVDLTSVLASSIYLNAGPTCLTRLGRNHVPAPLSQFSAAIFTSRFEENLVPDKYLEPRLGAKSRLYGGGSRSPT